MVCPKCGAEFPEGKAFCPGCGQPLISVEPPEVETATGEIARPAAAVRVRYAGFWLRFLAFAFDWLALSLVLGPLSARLFPNLELPNPPPISTADPAAAEIALREFFRVHFFQRLPTILVAEVIIFSVMGVYFSLMESSAWQATLGKRLLGLRVVDMRVGRISFARATARHFAKLLSSFSFGIGYVMAGFTKRKQALHDILAECLVIRKPPSA